MFNAQRIFQTILILSLGSLVRAQTCFEDQFGNIDCNGLSIAARVGIGIGIFVLFALLIALYRYRQQRIITQRYLLNQRISGYYPPPQAGFQPGYVAQHPLPQPPGYVQGGYQPGYEYQNSPPPGAPYSQYGPPPGAPPPTKS